MEAGDRLVSIFHMGIQNDAQTPRPKQVISASQRPGKTGA